MGRMVRDDRKATVTQISTRAVKLTEKLNSNFILKYYQNSNYIQI